MNIDKNITTIKGKYSIYVCFWNSINPDRLTIRKSKINGGYFLDELEDEKEMKVVSPDKNAIDKIE